jgi:membrane fusion protein (multidrug efflux system)
MSDDLVTTPTLRYSPGGCLACPELRMSRFGASLLSVTLVAFSLACGMGRGEEDDDGDWGGQAIERATVVETQAVSTGSVGDTLSSSAVVESEIMADLFPVTSGIVTEIRVEEGDAVVDGQILAIVDNATVAAGSARARADVERLQGEVARLESLASQGAVSSREVEEARYNLGTARTSAWEAGASVGQTRIKSPINGIIAMRDIRVGELASSGARAFQVVDLDRLRVVASLPERDLPRISVGQSVTLVSAYDPNVKTTGIVGRVAPVVDPTSGTFRVTVDLSQNQSVLRPGQFVSVEIEVDRHDDVVVIPREAVVYEDGSPVAYRMIDKPIEPDTGDEEDDEDADSDTQDTGPKFVAERVAITVGLMDNIWAEITEGIELDDEVVVVGQSNLRDNAPIRTPTMVAEAEARAEARDDAAADKDSE